MRMYVHEGEWMALMVEPNGNPILAVFMREGIICEINDRYELYKLKIEGQDLTFGQVSFKWKSTFLVHTAVD